MIISFSVSNFRSFAEEQTISFVASKRLSKAHETHAVPIPNSDEHALKVAVLYGANGAGKSNVVKAIRYLDQLVRLPRSKGTGTGRDAFVFWSEKTAPSVFDIQFVATGKLYRYNLKLDDKRIIEEGLVEIIGSKEKIIFERITDGSDKVTVDAPNFKKHASEKLKALTVVGGLPNQSFLATVRANLKTEDYENELGEVLDWFINKLFIITPQMLFSALGIHLERNRDFLQFANEFLKSSSTGVDHLRVEKKEITPDEFKALLPKNKAEAAPIDELEEGYEAVTRLNHGTWLVIDRIDQKSHFYRITVQAAHEHQEGNVVPLELAEESDGTRRLLDLIPALHHLKITDAVYVIDEIDRSMHPSLVWKFLDFFLKSCGNGQLLITTHESNLLDLELLRRDEIWFAEKDAKGSSHLYSLAEFKVRNDLELRKHYLQGRFGAIPFLGDIDRLLPDRKSKNGSFTAKTQASTTGQ